MRTAGPKPGEEQQIYLALCEVAHPTLLHKSKTQNSRWVLLCKAAYWRRGEVSVLSPQGWAGRRQAWWPVPVGSAL